MKKGPLEFKRPKFWEERDGGLIPSIAPFHLRSAGSKFKYARWARGFSHQRPSRNRRPRMRL